MQESIRTRVRQDHSCPPRGMLMQGWESEGAEVEGIPLVKDKMTFKRLSSFK